MKLERDYLVNKNIQRIIKEKGLKKTAVAKRAGIKNTAFWMVCSCKRPVYADEICPIAAALGVPIDELFKEAQQAG